MEPQLDLLRRALVLELLLGPQDREDVVRRDVVEVADGVELALEADPLARRRYRTRTGSVEFSMLS